MYEPLLMRISVLYPALFILLLFTGYIRQPECKEIFKQIAEELNVGNLKKTGLLADSLKAIYGGEDQLINKADSLSQIAERIYLEFPFAEEQIISQDVRYFAYLADSIVGQEGNPFEIVRSIYYWLNENIPWAGALEYSAIPNIPQYVLRNRRGDCGMQTFRLMSMLRYKGIPVRWQSGWMMPPGHENLHDWYK
jgi:hypothetical protein